MHVLCSTLFKLAVSHDTIFTIEESISHLSSLSLTLLQHLICQCHKDIYDTDFLLKNAKIWSSGRSWANETDSVDPTVPNRKSEYEISSIYIRSRSTDSVGTSTLKQRTVQIRNVPLAFKAQHVSWNYYGSPGKRDFINLHLLPL